MTKTYTFIIGTTDDFEGLDHLIDHYDQEGVTGSGNYQVIEFEAPEGADEETVTMIGRGHAFSSDWSMDGTYSFLHEGSVPTDSEEWFVHQGEKAKDELASTGGWRQRTEQQDVNPYETVEDWDPSDPTNW